MTCSRSQREKTAELKNAIPIFYTRNVNIFTPFWDTGVKLKRINPICYLHSVFHVYFLHIRHNLDNVSKKYSVMFLFYGLDVYVMTTVNASEGIVFLLLQRLWTTWIKQQKRDKYLQKHYLFGYPYAYVKPGRVTGLAQASLLAGCAKFSIFQTR